MERQTEPSSSPPCNFVDNDNEHGNQSDDLEDNDIIVDAEDDTIKGGDALRTASSSSTAPKRSKRNPSIKCPICHEIVSPGQYQQHYKMELAQLESCASNNGVRGKRGAAIAATKHFSKGKSRGSASDNEKRDLIRDVQKRRTTRQSNKDTRTTDGRGLSDFSLELPGALGDTLSNGDAPATCFICNEQLFGSLDDINSHIDSCLTNPQSTSIEITGIISSGTNTPVSGGASVRSSTATTPNERMSDSFEEYTWAGQTRVRATALFEGGMGSLGTGARLGQEDIDDDLNVEDDEEDEYGDAQFTERDVVMNDSSTDADELREIALESSAMVQRSTSPAIDYENKRSRIDKDMDIDNTSTGSNDIDDDIDEDEEIDLEGIDEEDEKHRLDAMINSAFASGDTKLVIDALRSKIKHLDLLARSL
ncbi:hypothetical protein BGZ76_011678 [Entomortierella beljakovae]|nr:hypothetical protein BGZ76_011678 [Entomortierella beljakovae]